MAENHDTRNPPPVDIITNLQSLTEVRLQVDADHQLGCVTVDISGLQPGLSAIMSTHAALDMSWRLTRAVAQIRQRRLEQPSPGSAGPFSSRF